MKKILTIGVLLLLVLQVILPSIVVAKTISEEHEINFQKLEMDSKSEKNGVIINVGLKANTKQETVLKFTVSKNFTLEKLEKKDIVDHNGIIQGYYQIKDDYIEVSILANVIGDVNLSIKGSIAENNKEKSIVFNLADETKSVDLPTEWLEPTDTDGDSTNENSDSAVTEEKPKEELKQQEELVENKNPINVSRVNQDIRDIYQTLNKEDNFLQTMVLAFTDKDGNSVVNPMINDTLHFAFTFILDEDVRQLVKAGDYFTFQLPNTVKITQKQTYELLDGDGIHYADVTINLNGTVVVTFTNEVENSSDIRGEFHFTASFDKSNIPNPGTITIIPGTYEALKVTVQIKPNYVGNSIEKKGHFNKVQNPNQIIWNVDINKALELLENTQIKEELPPGTTFDSLKIYTVQVDFSGNVIEGSEIIVDPNQYNVDSNGNVTFNGVLEDAYRIEYTTTINEEIKPGSGGVVDFINRARLLTKNNAEATAEATVSAKYGKELEKARGNYNTTAQTIDWKIAYNYGEKSIINGSLTDTFQNEFMVLVPNSVKIFELSFTESGTPIRGKQLVLGVDYEVNQEGHGFSINFVGTIQKALDIRYQTGYDGIIETNIPLKNEVVTSSGQTDSSTGTYTQQNVIKRLGSVDYSKQTVSWTIDVNRNNYTMKNWVLTDSASPGLAIKEETFKIYDNNTKQFLVKDVDYSYEYDEVSRIIKVKFINSYSQTDHSFKISYTDNYDTESEVSPDLKYINKAHVVWETIEGKTIESENQQTFYPNEPTRYNGSKSGSYNAISKNITWSVAINYRDKDLENGKIIDPIQAGQNYIRDSIKIYHYTTGIDGSIIKGDELTATEYLTMGIQQPSVGNNQVLIVNFPNHQSENYLVEFQTSLVNEQVHAKYKNDAIFSNDNYQDYKLHAEVSVAHGDEFLTKKGIQDNEGYVNWGVTINGSQSTLYDVTIDDTPSANQAIDLSSLHLYDTSVNDAGVISPDLTKELVQGKDYLVEFTTNNITGEQRLVIHLKGAYLQLERALIMNYRTMVFLESSQGTVTNEIKIKSTGKTEIETGIDSQLSVIVSEGGGSASGTRGKVTIKKVDENGGILPKGATFELLDKNKKQVLRSGEVDGNGLITFGMLTYGSYILREKNTLTDEGYTIDQSLVDGINISINASTTQGTPIVIQNALGEVKLTKVSENGQKLQDAEFRLEVYDVLTSNWVTKTINQNLKTIYDGTLTIKGLSPGRYRLIEIKAPVNYILNTTPAEFEVAINEHNQLIQLGLSDNFINYQAAVHFTKKNVSGVPLQGSVFEIYSKENLQTPLSSVNSDENGQVQFGNLGPGQYKIKEKQSTGGYILNLEELDFEVPEQTDKPIGVIELGKDFINYQGSIEVLKKGISSSGNTNLEGVEFNLENEQGVVVQSGTTNNEGVWLVENVVPGTYYLSEVSVGSNIDYILNKEKIKVVIEPQMLGKPKKVEVELNNYKGDIKLKKVDSKGNALKGAEFSIYKQEDSSIVQSKLTSDENGLVNAADLSPGMYYLKETKAPIDSVTGEEFILNEFPIIFEIVDHFEGKPETIDLKEFQNFKGKVNFNKVGKGDLPIAGAKFALYEAVGSTELFIKEIEVGDNGTIDIDDLSPGAYKLIEVESPLGYVRNLQPVYFSINEGEEGLPPVEILSIINYEVGIKFTKISDKKDLVSEKLGNAVFEIQDSQGHVVPVYDSLNNLVSNFSTNELGEVEVTGLKAGNYKLVEKSAPEGYIRNTESVSFIIEEVAGEPQHIILDLGTIVNYQGSLKIVKKNSSGINLNGGKFELRDLTGKAIEVNTEYGMKTTHLTAIDGIIAASGIVPGSYYLVEVDAPTGYIKEENTEILPIEIPSESNGEQGTIIIGQLINYQGEVLLNKVDEATRQPLTNAKFSLYTKDNKINKQELITNKKGQIELSSLVPGEYYFLEDEAPEGYNQSTERYSFTIDSSSKGKPKQKIVTATNSTKKTTISGNITSNDRVDKNKILGQLGDYLGYGTFILGSMIVLSIVGYKFRKKNS